MTTPTSHQTLRLHNDCGRTKGRSVEVTTVIQLVRHIQFKNEKNINLSQL